MAKTKTLSETQLKALAYAATHKGFVTDAKAHVARVTLKSLDKIGLLAFHAASPWRHGEGNVVQYKVTPMGRELIVIGRMFRALSSEVAS